MSTSRARAAHTDPPAPPPSPAVHPLENGDRLSRDEFERRYEAMPELKKAELIDGVVYVGSPVRHHRHGRPHSQLNFWLWLYASATPGLDVGDNVTVRLDGTSETQPDCVLFIRPECGGRVRFGEDDYIEGAPELVAEVASSSVSYDLGPKLEAYRRSGVVEYVVWRVLDREIDWLALRGGAYERLPLDAETAYRSEAFPGLRLDPAALLAGDMAAVQAAVGLGLASPEHARFLAGLEAARAAR